MPAARDLPRAGFTRDIMQLKCARGYILCIRGTGCLVITAARACVASGTPVPSSLASLFFSTPARYNFILAAFPSSFADGEAPSGRVSECDNYAVAL